MKTLWGILLGLGVAIWLLPIVAQAQPVITQQPANQMVVAGGNATFSVAVSGTGPFTYQWQFNGTNLPNGIITTVAGNGTNGYSGDGGAATNAALFYPYGVAVDTNGDLFIADAANNCIRKVSTNGIITTVAGNGTNGYSGDGGAATNAALNYPVDVAVDTSGNLFIADFGNNRFRKVSTNGIITTVAGGGVNYTSDGGAATNAALSALGVAVDTSGNLFIADFANNRIHKVSTNGIITTVAGNGINGYSGDGGTATNATLNYPYGVAVDTSSNLFIVDYYNQRIRKVSTNGIITTVAGNGSQSYSGDGGAATDAALNFPSGVAVDASGNLFIADFGNNRIRKVSTNGIITTVAGNGSRGYSGDGGAATNAALFYPNKVALDTGGNFFIADVYNQRIRKVDNSAGLPSLVLKNVTAKNSGRYSVIVTDSSGSVTSSMARLSLGIPPNHLVPAVTLAFTLSEQGGSNVVNTVSTTANPVKIKLATKEFLTMLAVDENREGNWPSNSFPKSAALALVDDTFFVINGTNALLNVSDIISLEYGEPQVTSGKRNLVTGLASTSAGVNHLAGLVYDDTDINGSYKLRLYLYGVVRATITDTVPSNRIYTETFKISNVTLVGDGYYQGVPFTCTGIISASGKGSLHL